MTKKELFQNIGIQPPKGVLMYGPPGELSLLNLLPNLLFVPHK